MKTMIIVMVLAVSLTLAMDLKTEERDIDSDHQREYADGEEEDGCLTEEQECTHDRDGCCRTGDMTDAVCNCYSKRYFDHNPQRPEFTKCYCNHNGTWWDFNYNVVKYAHSSE